MAHKWWKEAVVYQIWPASFCDSNGDGWGDVQGMISKLDHIKNLGADVLWVSPIMKSPQIDMGYDISDYKDIDPKYGTLADVDELIAELKKRDMKLMWDLVVNHTSDQHAWFKESRSSKDNPKRDWYIWKPARYDDNGDRQPPNNWALLLGNGNSAWTWDETTQEYYLALFTPEQPDLNWETPEVRAAVHDVMKFWLEKGVCGFRLDVINHISKVQSFPDAPITVPGQKYQPGYMYFANGPRLHEYLEEMHDKVLSKYDTMTVGEMPFVDEEKEILKVVGHAKELSMIFIFALVNIDSINSDRMTIRDWEPKEIKEMMNRWQRCMIDNDGWNSIFCENHDNGRSVSRFTDDSDEWRDIGSKLMALMMTTLSGTPYVYQGQEIGQRNFPMSWSIEEYKDVESINYWEKMNKQYPGDSSKIDYARKVLQAKARDHARTPVQWTAGENADFCATGVKPWMRVNEDYKEINVAAQTGVKDDKYLSVLEFWKRGLASRKKNKEAFVYGGFELVDVGDEQLFAYQRNSKESNWFIMLNFTGKEANCNIPTTLRVKKWVAGNYVAGAPEKPTTGVVKLKPWEGVLAQLM